MSTLIIPCAGKSTRFSDVRPKYMLVHPFGDLMLVQSILGLDLSDVKRIVITLVKEHIEDYKLDLQALSDRIFELKNIKPDFCILENFTASQSETVYQTILASQISGPIHIKDCDNYFETLLVNKNNVCISTLSNDMNATNKSYVSIDKFGYLSGIVEKQIIGNTFCVGCYSFQNANEFIISFKEVINMKSVNTKEIYISHIIQNMILNDKMFEIQLVKNYLDWGTIEDWNKYRKQFNTIFVDLDGILVYNASEFFEPKWGTSQPLQNNIEIINNLYDSGKSMIIITTSRKDKYKLQTLQQLQDLNIKFHKIIFDLPHAQRILINDFSNSNPYPSATAISIKRDGDNLKEML